jgi:hypothetical protein
VVDMGFQEGHRAFVTMFDDWYILL